MVAVSTTRTAPALALAFALLVPLLAWSRMTMKRHTWTEILLGSALGIAAGFAILV